MLISYNWLKELLPGLTANPQEIAEKLSQSLAEVEKPQKKNGDFVLEIDNKALSIRPDCFGQLGLAREIAAIFNLRLEKPTYPRIDDVQPPTTQKSLTPLTANIETPHDCLRYTVVKLGNLKIAPSPDWLCQKLLSLDVRPINNLVDITNFVMLETAQPLHAFDAKKIWAEPKVTIEIRRAKPQEKIRTLDNIERTLTTDDLVIASNLPNQSNTPNQPIALAGIMGGKNSEVDQNTSAIILESANFNPILTRKTSKRLGLRTDASGRFEKNQDANLTLPALLRAIKLYQEIAFATVDSLIIDEYPEPQEPQTLNLNFNEANRFLGAQIDENSIFKILQSLEIEVQKKNEQYFLTIPTFRKDLKIAEDIYEEIGRLYNFNNIVPTLPYKNLKAAPQNFSWELQKKTDRLLKFLGFNEVYTYSFIGAKLLEKSLIEKQGLAELKNPLSPDLQYLRPLILPSILEKTVLNKSSFDKFSLFETSFITPSSSQREKTIDGLFSEPKNLALLSFDKDPKNEQALFFKLKGALEELGQEIGLTLSFESLKTDDDFPKIFDRSNSLALRLKPEGSGALDPSGFSRSNPTLGFLGLINPLIKRNFGLEDGNVVIAEFNLNLIQKEDLIAPSLKPISSFSPVINDLSIITSPDQSYEKIDTSLRNFFKNESPIQTAIDFKDLYQQKNGQKILTFRLTFNSYKKQLTQTEINNLLEKVKKEMTEKLKVTFK